MELTAKDAKNAKFFLKESFAYLAPLAVNN